MCRLTGGVAGFVATRVAVRGCPRCWLSVAAIVAAMTGVMVIASPDALGESTDTTPPTVTVSGGDANWRATAVHLTLVATDDAEGSGVASITYRTDNRPPTTVSAAVAEATIAAPLDHSGDGTRALTYFATDTAGNVASEQTCRVRVDTAAPSVSDKASGDWQASPATIELMAEDDPVFGSRVLFVGDSLTAGLFATSKTLGFAPLLATWLSDHGCSHVVPQLANAGVSSGRTAAGAAEITAAAADLVVVELGTNDCSGYPTGVPVPIADYYRNMGVILAAARAGDPSCALIVCSIWQHAPSRIPYDEAARGVAAEFGAAFVDLSAIKDDQRFSAPAGVQTPWGTSDGWHPNDLGHEAIAADIQRACKDQPLCSGVTKVDYRVDDGDWTGGSTPTVVEDGEHRIDYRAFDAAGNASTVESTRMRVDASAPVTASTESDQHRPLSAVRGTGRLATRGLHLQDLRGRRGG